MERILCSLLSNLDWESSVDFTAKMSPERWEVAMETVAEDPRPRVHPLVQSMVWLDLVVVG